MRKFIAFASIMLLAIPVLGFGEEPLTYNNQPLSFWLKTLRSQEVIARVNAANVFAHFGPAARPAVAALVNALDDKSIDVRSAVIHALGRIGPDAAESIPKLTKLLEPNPDFFDIDVAKLTANALANVQPGGTGPLLVALLNSNAFLPGGRTTIDLSRLESLSALLKDPQPGTKTNAAVKGAGQIFSQGVWDQKADKWAETIDEQLKQVQEKAKDKMLEDAAAQARQDIKDYREQVRMSRESVKDLLQPDQEKWKNVIKRLAASGDGMRVLGRVVENNPDSAIAGMILREW
jgi:hypothetical protein